MRKSVQQPGQIVAEKPGMGGRSLPAVPIIQKEREPYISHSLVKPELTQSINQPSRKIPQPFTVQRQTAAIGNTGNNTRQPTAQLKANNTGLPDTLKSGVESLSGFDMSDVSVHYNSAKPAQLQALAYAQGTDIHIAPGQERHLPHEAWHVVQQKQGRVRPTIQMKGNVPVNDDAGLEHEADVMGGKAANGASGPLSHFSLKTVGLSNYKGTAQFVLDPDSEALMDSIVPPEQSPKISETEKAELFSASQMSNFSDDQAQKVIMILLFDQNIINDHIDLESIQLIMQAGVYDPVTKKIIAEIIKKHFEINEPSQQQTSQTVGETKTPSSETPHLDPAEGGKIALAGGGSSKQDSESQQSNQNGAVSVEEVDLVIPEDPVDTSNIDVEYKTACEKIDTVNEDQIKKEFNAIAEAKATVVVKKGTRHISTNLQANASASAQFTGTAEIEKLETGLSLLLAAKSRAEAGTGATADFTATYGKIETKIQATAQLLAELNAEAHLKIVFGDGGFECSAGAAAEASVTARASVQGSVSIAGYKIISAGVSAHAFAGAKAEAGVTLKIGVDSFYASAAVEAFAGAKAGVDANVKFGDNVELRAGLSAMAGIGTIFKADFGWENGTLTFDVEVGAAIGIGGSFRLGATINIEDIIDSIQKFIADKIFNKIKDKIGEKRDEDFADLQKITSQEINNKLTIINKSKNIYSSL